MLCECLLTVVSQPVLIGAHMNCSGWVGGRESGAEWLHYKHYNLCCCFSPPSDESLQEFSAFLRNLEDQRELMVRATSQNLHESQGEHMCVCVCLCLNACTVCIYNKPAPTTTHIWYLLMSNSVIHQRCRQTLHNAFFSFVLCIHSTHVGRALQFPGGCISNNSVCTVPPLVPV